MRVRTGDEKSGEAWDFNTETLGRLKGNSFLLHLNCAGRLVLSHTASTAFLVSASIAQIRVVSPRVHFNKETRWVAASLFHSTRVPT
jgi:hypothetical protein